jgi:hypothetical protein
MSTRSKCYALALEHDITIDVSENFGYEYSLSIPQGLQLEDYEGSRTGLSSCDIPNKAELWRELYADLMTIISYKPWKKVEINMNKITACDSCTEDKECLEYDINGTTFWHCNSCKEGK